MTRPDTMSLALLTAFGDVIFGGTRHLSAYTATWNAAPTPLCWGAHIKAGLLPHFPAEIMAFLPSIPIPYSLMYIPSHLSPRLRSTFIAFGKLHSFPSAPLQHSFTPGSEALRVDRSPASRQDWIFGGHRMRTSLPIWVIPRGWKPRLYHCSEWFILAANVTVSVGCHGAMNEATDLHGLVTET
jgi:hypothetical protein